jgi:hypothetical protein
MGTQSAGGVRWRRQPARNGLALADRLTALNVDFAQVGVDGFVAIAAPDQNHTAVAVCRQLDGAVTTVRRCNRRLVKSVPGSAATFAKSRKRIEKCC